MAVKKAKPNRDKFVDPLYSRNSGNPPIPSMPSVPTTMPTRTWGAGDPDYIKKMIASGKSKPVKRK
jgi:hypothetical protein